MGDQALRMNSLLKGLLLCVLVLVGAQATRLPDHLEKALLEEIAADVGTANSTAAPSSATTAAPSVLTTTAPSNLTTAGPTTAGPTHSPNKFEKAGRDTKKWLEGAGKDIHGAFKSLFGQSPAPTTSPLMLFVGIATATVTLLHA